MKTPDRCRSGTPPSAENGLRGLYFGVWCYRRPTIGASPATFHTVSLSPRGSKGRRKYGSFTHWTFARCLWLLAHHHQQSTPPGGWLRYRQLAPRQLRAGLGSDLRYPPDKPAASSRLCCPHLVPTYPPPPLPRPSLIGCGLLGSSSFCPKMNEAELSPQVSCVSDPDPTTAEGPLTSFSPKRNATDHRFLSVAGCATGSTRLLSAHNWSGLLSLYFGLFPTKCT